jgi:hypothetical protein
MPAGAITIFGPFNSVEPTAPLAPRIANLPTGFDPSEESIEGFVEPAQRSLLAGIRPDGHIRSHTADLRQLGRLIRVPDPGLAMHPAIATLLQGRVVELAVRLDTRRQCDVLASAWTQPNLYARLMPTPHPTHQPCHNHTKHHRQSGGAYTPLSIAILSDGGT